MNYTSTLLPPGTILQHLYLKERLQHLTPGKFVEVGPGAGDITGLLLSEGWTGLCYDLNKDTITKLETRFDAELSSGTLAIRNDDFLKASDVNIDKVDLVISCMVIEHLNDHDESRFLQSAKMLLKKNGRMIGLVPASHKHWGIEDDIAGHYRRYSDKSLSSLVSSQDWTLEHISGLTFPLSNCLLPISNFLVNRNEANKVNLSMKDKTKLSGIRKVLFKTKFPAIAAIVLNSWVLRPFHYLQKIFSNSKSCLVLYFEASPPRDIDGHE